MLARDNAQWARFVGGKQSLRLPHRDAGTEEDCDASRPKEGRLLACGIRLEAPNDGLRGMLGLIVQALERGACALGQAAAVSRPKTSPRREDDAGSYAGIGWTPLARASC
jgi:hypothetical protein